MADFNDLTTAELWATSRQIALQLSRPTPTTIQLTWQMPASRTVLDGFIIVLSERMIDPSCAPTDTVRYSASLDFAAPVDSIGHAQVVASHYVTFGDAVLADTGTITITNTNADKIYYASIHGCSNVLQYYTLGVQSYPLESSRIEKKSNTFSGSITTHEGPPANPDLGTVYYDPIANNVQMWTGTVWVAAGVGTVSTGTSTQRPISPSQGDFFYNKDTQQLEIWNGTAWNKANTQYEGTPMYAKIGVGDDGTYDERLRLMDVLKRQLGYPQVCVELNEESFNIAIDNAIEEFRRRADNAYAPKYVVYTLKPEQSMYYLNDPRVGTDRVVDIIKIHRINMLGLNGLGGDAGIYSQIFFNQFYQSGMIDILSIHLISSMAEDYQRIFAGDLMFNWNEASRQLTILRRIYKEEKVVLECVMERTEQELLVDRFAKQWLQAWAESELMIMLGHIRSKYASGLPGANGGISLNGTELISNGQEMQTELLRQLYENETGGMSSWGNVSFLIG